MADTACWILTRADGATYSANWPATTHFRHEDEALVQAGVDSGWRPRQLDRPCVVVVCSGCRDVFGDCHWPTVEEVHDVMADSEWDRWTILPDGSYRCDVCKPSAAVATPALEVSRG